MVHHIVCSSVSNFDDSLASAIEKAGSKPLVLMFTGAIITETGRSWCPDCTAAAPVIKAECNKVEGSVLLEIPITREDFRNQDLMYRTRSDLAIKCVPTTMRWGTQNKLDDSQSQKQELVAMLLEDL